MDAEIREKVRDYYGKVLQGTNDLKTSACCAAEAPDPHLRRLLEAIDDEILARFYGCGSPIPPAIEGMTVLDLGCGTGRDAYLCAQLVGESGRVIGLDMTEEQLEVARRHRDPQARRFGHSRPNVEFRQGYLEDLEGAGIADRSVDVVISNCVINLSPDKERVFEEILRVLRPGGELYFSDVFCDRRLPESVQRDPVLVGECLGGALYTEDFRRILLRLGVPDYRVVRSRPITLEDPDVETRVGIARFFSMTVRLFPIGSLEDRCEDYGQVAWYRGTIENAPHAFLLDDHHEFVTGKPLPVCGNTAAMLTETRLAPHFRVDGDRSVHHGLFDCAPTAAGNAEPAGGCC